MTQYPSPYSPPPYPPQGYVTAYGYGPSEDLFAPARRAGILMIVLGALTIVIGLCMGLGGAMLPQMMDQMPADQRQMFDQMQQQLPPSITLSGIFLVFACVMVVVGLLYIVLGLFTRRGGLGIVITSIVLTTLVSLVLLVSTIGSLTHPGQAMGACTTVIALALFVLLLAWLVQAARATSRISQMQADYQAQYQQYLRAQQMYGQQGYGYGAPQAPPPPPASGQSPPSDQK